MKRYTGINYEKIEDCFKKTKDIESILLYGDISHTPSPWLTIVVPTYKRPGLLLDSLKSILRQWHTDFFWDIVIVDNEPYNNKPNETERLVRKLDNDRILYYRNTDNMRPGDNFNRGIFLARGKWVMMLHDDDLLVDNTVQNIGNLIKAYQKISSKPLGAIACTYYQFSYTAKYRNRSISELSGINSWLCSNPLSYNLYKLTHWNVIFTSHIGGCIPSNGATYLRKAVIEAGGFNDDFGISADLILYYCIETCYSVFCTTAPYGFYRWGQNTMIKRESTYKTIKAGYDFREYIYSRHPIIGAFFRRSHYRKFTSDVIAERNNVAFEKLQLPDFNDIYSKRPNKLVYYLFTHLALPLFSQCKKLQSKRIEKKAIKSMEE